MSRWLAGIRVARAVITTTTTRERPDEEAREPTVVSLDGAIENPRNWSLPYCDDEHADYARKLLWDADALLLGRKTYEGAQVWPTRPAGDEYTHGIDALQVRPG